MPRLRQCPDALLTRLGEISAWQTAGRDDAKVALEVHETRAVDRVYALDQAAFFDELFHYIREIGAWPLFEQLDPNDRKGALYPFMQFVLFTIMRCVGGVQSMLATYELLLTDEALNLPCDWWNEQGSKSSKANSKRFEPKRLNATVVLRWDGAPKDAQKEVVLLTNDPADDPFVAFDRYDDRSLIENSCNREAKEHWFLEHHPKRSEAAVRVHAYFIFLCMALVAAFRAYKAKTDEQERRGQDTGISRYRRRLLMLNRDKLIVFLGDSFGIFRSWEFALLTGVVVREHAVLGQTAHTVLRRYGVELPDPGS